MKIVRLLLLASASFCFSLSAYSAPDTSVADFALLDHLGKFHRLSYYGDQRAIVMLVQTNNDAAARQSASDLELLRADFEQLDVVFFMLNPSAADDRHSIAAEAKSQGYTLPILVDESQLVAESLGVSQTGEVLVIDPATMQTVYQGRGGEAGNDVRKALEALLDGGKPLAGQSVSTGMAIEYTSSAGRTPDTISYRDDIAPILTENCVSCHHDGGIGPWSMSSHAMVQGWSKMMREVVMTRRMPPGQIDHHVGKPIADMAGLTTREQQLLIHWIDAGAPADANGEDPLAKLTFTEQHFTMGEPDIILKVPAQSIPATGVIDYRYVPVQLNLDRDVWVRAMETVPGDRQVLHHVIAYVSSPADKSARGEDSTSRDNSLGGFAPGRQPDAFRDNSGKLLRKGSNLLLQMHYTTSGKATVDETEIGLYLYDKPPQYVMSGGVAGLRRFMIPPHTKEYPMRGEQLVEHDAWLYSLMPHMHYRGKYMSYIAEYPDGSSEVLLSVPNYEFNWQFNYQLKEPHFLPAGTRLVTRGAMDNSDRNPYNPDPSKPVHFGLQTKHEMFFGFNTLRYDGDTPGNRVTFSDEKTAQAKSKKAPGVAGL
ncbi:redoxin domain-containing protein [Halieaceae bacterium IMCC14734]|uniref:Redoxin domain-containing protein n=1 Tax=Candidatus Litorirhabdus singularis TaxID=2518993 RepID=A0ABT3TBL7_9GAMM|nr:redoxin domain-containing protein [Candidatus Litorirhabdus singularis]MCX2979645.1 redoxin domain-containing protein [Candidatus Litorirhabdus singularis]